MPSRAAKVRLTASGVVSHVGIGSTLGPCISIAWMSLDAAQLFRLDRHSWAASAGNLQLIAIILPEILALQQCHWP